MIRRDMPVISSTSSWTVTLSMMSLKRTEPPDSLLHLLSVAHLEARAVDHGVALAHHTLVVDDRPY
jgi:hypothetical protein